MMLTHFPKPYPNEDFRSIIYRFYIRSGHISFVEVNKILFDSKTSRMSYFHQNTKVLVNLLDNKKYDLKYFLNSHTVFPIIQPFISKQRSKRFINSLNKKNTLKNKKIWHNIDSKIKYCPVCIIEDFKIFGEVFAHRYHQFDFLDFCYLHYSELVSTCRICGVQLSSQESKQLMSTPKCINGHDIGINQPLASKCPSFIRLLINDLIFIDSLHGKMNKALIIELFYIALGNKGYMDIYSGNIKITKLKDEFQCFLNDKLPILNHTNLVNSHFSILLSKTNNHAPNILIYILLILFLSNSVTKFISPNYTYSICIPFKNEPQPCFNVICDSYNKPIIKTYKKSIYALYVQGTFKCPMCGYIYGRKWVWLEDKRDGEIGAPFLISRGELWNNEVLKLYSQGLSIKDISFKMGVYKEPIAKFLKDKLGVEYVHRYNPRNNTLFKHLLREENTITNKEVAILEISSAKNESAASKFDEKRLTIRRNHILNLINENPKLGRKKIEELARSDYRWLIKYDREWMNKFLPPPFSK